jgi:tetratricopeptide (TPR) repeat protein
MNLDCARPSLRPGFLSGRLFVLALFPGLLCSGCGARPAAPAVPAPHPRPVSAPPPGLSAVEARAQLVGAIRIRPDDPQASLNLALFDRDAGDTPQAEQELTALWKRFPHFAAGPYHLGTLSLNLGRNEAALPPLRAAADLAKEDAEIQVMAGLACFRLGRYEEARQYAQRAIRIDPQSASPYLLLTRIYSNHGTAAQSQAALNAYLKRAKDPAPGYYLMGRFYYRQFDPADAERCLQRALAADPKNADYLAMLGHIYGDLKNGARLTEGIALYAQALAIRPDDWETQAALGRALMQRQQWEPAISHLQAATRLAPDPGPILYSLGQALLRGGHADEGRRMLVEYQAYRDYTSGAEKFKQQAAAHPQDRSRRIAWARFCLQYGQYAAAETVLSEIARRFGEDDTLRQLSARIQADRRNGPPQVK